MSDTISLQRLPPSNGWFEYHESGTFVRMLKPGRSPGLTRNGPSEGPMLMASKLRSFIVYAPYERAVAAARERFGRLDSLSTTQAALTTAL
ncbi:hypothetical protein [Bradyrhizobium sp. USDA 4452]